MIDFAWGGIYDDAYSATLATHLIASMSRVYGGFALAALFALPIGLLIGRMPTARMLLDPFLQVMRPIPVTAWLPLSMILFGLGAKSAFALSSASAPSIRSCSTPCSACARWTRKLFEERRPCAGLQTKRASSSK